MAQRIADVRAAAEKEARDPAEIELSAIFGSQMADPKAGAEQFMELGVDRAMVPAFFFAGPGGMDRLADFAGQVMVARS